MKHLISSIVVAAALCSAVGVLPPFTPASAWADDDHHHEKGKSLGKVKIGAYEVEAIQEGKIEPGKETVFELKLTGSPEPTAIRAWIGIESARGSVKAKSHKHGEEISIHPEVPEKIPEGAKLWIEIETPGGKTRGSLAYNTD